MQSNVCRITIQNLEISCLEVQRELSNYIDDELTRSLRSRIEMHVSKCPGCRAVFDGVRNVILLLSSEELIELPPDFSRRLYERLMSRAVQ
jgi:predicted anti-sigma-YlaC factor YlaD